MSVTLPPISTARSATRPAAVKCRTHIHGVSLYNKAGKPRRNFLWEAKLRILGCTEAELDAFIDEYAPRREGYIITRISSGSTNTWTTPHWSPNEEKMRGLVVRHLLGARLPGLPPQWLGTKAWPTTKQIVIDVDRHDISGEEFRARCAKVESCLALLGIDLANCLITPSPGGGRHYRVFLSKPFPTNLLPTLLEMVGLPSVKGVHEVFPSTTLGLRLPFGHVPHDPHPRNEWRKHVRDLQRGHIHRYDPEVLRLRALDIALTVNPTGHQPTEMPRPVPRPVSWQPRPGPTSRPILALATLRQDPRSLARYDELLANKPRHAGEIEELWQTGILREGTRWEVLGRVIWHVVHVKKYDEDQAVEEISRWTYEPGRHASKDIRSDQDHGTRQMETEIRARVRWHLAKRTEQPRTTTRTTAPSKIRSSEAGTINDTDIRVIVRHLRNVSGKDRKLLALFAVHVLAFAKTHGQTTDAGWECCIATHGVLRKFPGCSGTRGQKRMAWATSVGFIEVTQEKRQSPDGSGRARRYLIRVPTTASTTPTPTPNSTHSPEEAADIIIRAGTFQGREKAALCGLAKIPARYLDCFPTPKSPAQGHSDQPSVPSRLRDRLRRNVGTVLEHRDHPVEPTTPKEHPRVPILFAPHGVPKRFRLNRGNAYHARNPLHEGPYPQTNPCHSRPQRPARNLEQGQTQCGAVQHAPQAVSNAADRREQAIPSGP